MAEEKRALAYCPSCKKMVEFETKKETKINGYDGDQIEYEARSAYCVHCGEELAYDPYEEEGAQAYAEALRIHKGIVPLSIIRDLPKKYHIGKRPLSLLLGWGEITYSRYLEGHVPSQSYSRTIQRLFDNPADYEELLERNRGRISNRAYQNSKKAVKRVIESEQPETEKMLEVASGFCVLSGGNIGAREIEKLGGRPMLRDFTTDNGNKILDVHGWQIADAVHWEEQLNQIVGVVTVGLFAKRGADVLLLGTSEGVKTFVP